MTAFQKEQVTLLRQNGASYASIAKELSYSVNTIKSYCQRNSLGVRKDLPQKSVCEQCKKAMRESRQKARRFCSDQCRMAWWSVHPDQRNRGAVYHFTCAFCRKPFMAYGNAHRKYCSRACYGKSKVANP